MRAEGSDLVDDDQICGSSAPSVRRQLDEDAVPVSSDSEADKADPVIRDDPPPRQTVANTRLRGLRRLLAGAGTWVVGGVLAPVVVGVVVWRVTTGGKHTPNTTVVSVLRPYTGDRLSPSLQVTKTVRGNCGDYPDGRAHGSGNPEAVRCFGDDSFVYDPCYVSQTGTRLACPARPWSSRVTVIRPSHPARGGFREDFPGPGDRAYGMQLADGQRCSFVDGAGQVTVAGVRVNYQCERGDVVGSPDRREKLWHATYVSRGEAETEVVNVTRVWF